jgi:1,2-dihydroxy-3-keto-5-methylthiopentene dioxygenase
MAKILISDNTAVTDFPVIQKRLARLGITLNAWPAPTDVRARALLEQKALNDAEKEELLGAVQNRFETLKQEHGYTTRDMIVIHEDIPGLKDMLAKFERIHYHTDDEVRYILAGRGYFGFVEPDGGQFLLEVSAGDYINVPANAEHWFTMRDSRRIKAVRYFIDTSGWAPVYTERALQFA